MDAVFVAEGEVVEEVFYGLDAAFGERGGYAFADAFEEFDRGVEREDHRCHANGPMWRRFEWNNGGGLLRALLL